MRHYYYEVEKQQKDETSTSVVSSVTDSGVTTNNGVLPGTLKSNQPISDNLSKNKTDFSAAIYDYFGIDIVSDDPIYPTYPAGSVVAQVLVAFQSMEKYEVTLNNETTADGVHKEIYCQTSGKRVNFTGCISGQVDLDWQVTIV